MIYVTNYFISSNKDRQVELEKVLKINIEHKAFIKIILMHDGKQKSEQTSDKIVYVECKERPTYIDYFNYVNKHHEGEICVLANLDIAFDDTVWVAYTMNLDKTVLALTRWDSIGEGLDPFGIKLNQNSWSQDTWIFKSPVQNVDKMDANFTLGRIGCDNVIVYELENVGYKIINCPHTIKTYHFHKVQVWTYTDDNRLDWSRYRQAPIVNYKIEGDFFQNIINNSKGLIKIEEKGNKTEEKTNNQSTL